MISLLSPRVLLRPWKPEDAEAFSQLNADPEVMHYFPSILNRSESNAILKKMQIHFDKHGFGFWAAEHRVTGDFLGFIGLNIPNFEAHFTPCVEIGWRLPRRYWNQGLASEGALLCLEFAFKNLKLEEVVAFTSSQNTASRRVMEKIGMHHNPKDDFEHPQLTPGHPLRAHVLYRITNPRL